VVKAPGVAIATVAPPGAEAKLQVPAVAADKIVAPVGEKIASSLLSPAFTIVYEEKQVVPLFASTTLITKGSVVLCVSPVKLMVCGEAV
jgi:hypothetical protein